MTGAIVANDTVWLAYDAPYAGTVNSLTYFTGNGSFSVAIQINATNVTGLSAVAVSSATPATTNATAANTFTTGQRITAVITAATGTRLMRCSPRRDVELTRWRIGMSRLPRGQRSRSSRYRVFTHSGTSFDRSPRRALARNMHSDARRRAPPARSQTGQPIPTTAHTHHRRRDVHQRHRPIGLRMVRRRR